MKTTNSVGPMAPGKKGTPDPGGLSATAAAAQQALEKASASEGRTKVADADPCYRHDAATTLAAVLKDAERGAFFTTPPDWTALRAAAAARTAASPRWFMQVFDETLPMVPGAPGEPVQVCPVQILEVALPTRPPQFTVVREHLPFANNEDLAPEKLVAIADLGLVWRPVTLDDGKPMNAFVLAAAAEADAATGSGAAFSFGSAPGAPASAAPAKAPVAGFGAGAPVATGGSAPSFGFGKGASAGGASAGGEAAAPAATFGFGAAPKPDGAAKPAVSFGFAAVAPQTGGAAAAAPVGFGGGGTAAPAGFGGGGPKAAHPKDVALSLWTAAALDEFADGLREGCRVIADFTFNSADGAPQTFTLKLEDDTDDVGEAVGETLQRFFLKTDPVMRAFADWAEACPTPKLSGRAQMDVSEGLSAVRNIFLADLAAAGAAARLQNTMAPAVAAKLAEVKAARGALREAQLAIVRAMREELVDRRTVAPRPAYRTLKYYPLNDKVRFNPHPKISGHGICDVGQRVDVCVPENVKKQPAVWGAAA